MLATIWYSGLVIPFTNALIFLYHFFGNNMGLSILALSVVVRVVTLPLSISSLQSTRKQRALAPELAKIKEKFKDNKNAQMEAQTKFLKEHGLNPASGCLAMLVMIIPLFAFNSAIYLMLGLNANYALNNVLYDGLKFTAQNPLNFSLLYLNLGNPDPYLILPVLAAVVQFLLSKLMMPAISKEEKLARKTPEKTDDFMYNMQEQTLYLMPVMTILIGWKLASGLVLYWLLSSLLQLLQQLIMDGHLARWSKHLVKYVK